MNLPENLRPIYTSKLSKVLFDLNFGVLFYVKEIAADLIELSIVNKTKGIVNELTICSGTQT